MTKNGRLTRAIEAVLESCAGISGVMELHNAWMDWRLDFSESDRGLGLGDLVSSTTIQVPPDPLTEMVLNHALGSTEKDKGLWETSGPLVDGKPVVFMSKIMDTVAPQRGDWTPELYRRVEVILEAAGWTRCFFERPPRKWLCWHRPVEATKDAP